MPDPDPLPSIKTPWGSATPPTGAIAGDVPPVPIPDHTLIRRIGKGSYGEVWLARNALGVYRAVKIIDRRAFDDDRPFEREFAGMQRFEPVSRSHESQLNILQVGRGPHCFYYVMELADDMGDVLPASRTSLPAGESKLQLGLAGKPALQPDTYTPRNLRSELLLRGRLPVDECIRLGLALTTALEHLHRHGLVHRDIKPSNIVFVSGIPKLADIGLVALAESTMSFVGTEGYLPPEGPGTVQADLFSLGKVLYEISTGRDRQQFPELPTGISELPDRAALAEFNEVLLRACAPDVKQRYESAAEMHADLALLQSGKSVSRMRAVERRLKLAARAAVAVTVIAVLAGLAFFYQQIQTREARRLAAENKALAAAKTQLADTNARLARERGAAASESHRRLIQSQTANGLRAMGEDDAATAALWFAEALQRSEGDADLERRQRERLAALFRDLPKPIARLSLEHGGLSVRTWAHGRWIIGVGGWQKEGPGIGEVRIWDASSFRPLHSLIISNIWGEALVSPSGRRILVSEGGAKRIWDVTSGTPLASRLEVEGVGGASAWSPDETRLATVKHQGTNVYLLDALSGRRLTPPLQHSNRVVRVAFDPTGRWLATGTEIIREIFNVPKGSYRPVDLAVGQARVWDAATGQPVTDWIDVDDPGHGIEFNPDGSAVAVFGIGEPTDTSAGEQNSVRVIELPSGKARFAPLSHRNKLLSASFSPDGRYLATGTVERLVTLWNAHTGEAVHRALKHENVPYHSLRFSPDGAWLAVAGASEVRLWEVRSGKTVGPAWKGGESGFYSLYSSDYISYSSDGQRLITAASSGKIRVWDLAGVGPARPPFSHGLGLPITSAVFSPDGKRVFTVDLMSHLRIWDVVSGLPRGELLISTNKPPEMVSCLFYRASWSPDGTALVAPSGGSTACIWDAATGKERPFSLRHQKLVLFTEFSPDGKRIVTASDDSTARIWDASTGEPLTPPLQHRDEVLVARFSPDGRHVVTASVDGTARVWDATTGAPVSPPLEEGTGKSDGKPLVVLDARFSPDGTRVAMGGGSEKATLRDAVTGQPVGVAMQHGSTIWQLQFSPDGRRLLTTSVDRTARVWNVETGEPVTPPLVHDGWVSTGDFSPDGLRVITGSLDGTARIWDATTGEPLAPALRHEEDVLRVSFSPDGRRVCTSSKDGSAQLWETGALDWTNDELVAAARLLAGAQVGSSERIEVLEATQIEEAWRRVGSRLEGTAASSESAARWHRRRMIASERSRDWFAAEFHAHRLVELQPGDATALSDLSRISEALPIRRDPATPPELIDLSAFYNASLSESLHGGDGNHLAELPRGIQTFDRTRFDVRGLIQVHGGPYMDGSNHYMDSRFQYPKEVSDIRINRRLARLQFLHAIQNSAPDGTRVGHYLIHFANSRREEIPIIYGCDARDWWETPNVPDGVSGAVIAWKGTNPCAIRADDRGIRLFKRTWENPAPGVVVTKVDFVAEHDRAHPFLVALTAE